MKLTVKQKQEIDFLCREWLQSVEPTDQEKEDYIQMTVTGKKKSNKDFEKNPLFQAKRKLDINVKMWTKDLKEGILGYEEIIEDFNHDPYLTKVVDGIMKGVMKVPMQVDREKMKRVIANKFLRKLYTLMRKRIKGKALGLWMRLFSRCKTRRSLDSQTVLAAANRISFKQKYEANQS